MSLYHVGDVVTVRDDFKTGKKYCMADGTFPIGINETMAAFHGRQVTIAYDPEQPFPDYWYRIKEDSGHFAWADEMFECPPELPDINAEDLSELYDFILS